MKITLSDHPHQDYNHHAEMRFMLILAGGGFVLATALGLMLSLAQTKIPTGDEFNPGIFFLSTLPATILGLLAMVFGMCGGFFKAPDRPSLDVPLTDTDALSLINTSQALQADAFRGHREPGGKRPVLKPV